MKADYIRGGDVEKKLFARSKTNPVSGCLEWTAGKTSCGYGRIWYKGKATYAHRVAYERWIGIIPKNMHVLHTCDNPGCIFPEHLCLGSHKENMEHKSTRRRIHGSKNPNAKYTDEQREFAKHWTGSPSALSEQTGMSTGYICNLRKVKKFT